MRARGGGQAGARERKPITGGAGPSARRLPAVILALFVVGVLAGAAQAADTVKWSASIPWALRRRRGGRTAADSEAEHLNGAGGPGTEVRGHRLRRRVNPGVLIRCEGRRRPALVVRATSRAVAHAISRRRPQAQRRNPASGTLPPIAPPSIPPCFEPNRKMQVWHSGQRRTWTMKMAARLRPPRSRRCSSSPGLLREGRGRGRR